LYPSDIWCGLSCIRDNQMCIFEGCCLHRKQYLRVFNRKQRLSMKRYAKHNDDNGYIPYDELISLSKVYLKTGFVCWYCGRKMSIGVSNAPDTCSIEHKVAIANGGSNTLHNIVLCCEECNVNKGECDTVVDGLGSRLERMFPKYRGEH
jgi:5-methylcytosine-specific restriction endonuclease McrA